MSKEREFRKVVPSHGVARPLLLILPVLVLIAASELSADGLTPNHRFGDVAPYIGEPSEHARRMVETHCVTLGRDCLAFAAEHPELVRAVVPDNPAFWAAYEALLGADPMPLESVAPDTLPSYQGFIAGVTGWLRRELVTHGLADADRLHAAVMAHRRRLGLSNLLIDKMIFTATTGLLLPAINVHMAQRPSPPDDVADPLLDAMLRPLAPAELSLDTVAAGERRYASAALAAQPDAAGAERLELQQRVFDFVAAHSELDAATFWREGIDISAAVDVTPDLWPFVGHYVAYAVQPRYVDLSLTVLRALRAVYEGRQPPDAPSTPAPSGWRWRWDAATQALCLERGDVHPSVALDDGARICHPHLQSSAAAVHDSESQSPVASADLKDRVEPMPVDRSGASS